MSGNEREALSADTSFLIHVLQARQLPLLLHMHRVHVTELVLRELELRWERDAVDEAIADGRIQRLDQSDVTEMALLAGLLPRMGDGEASAIAAATHHKLLLATDDCQPPVVRAIGRLLNGRALSFQDFLRNAIEQGLMSVQDADDIKDALGQRYQYRLPIRSFADVVRQPLR